MDKFSSAQTILITGGTGSFGRTMLLDCLTRGVQEVRVFSRDEEKQDLLRNQICDDRVKYYIGDIRDYDAVVRATRGVDVVFHAAALKQVPSCEFFPNEAVNTNFLGSSNVINAGVEAGVSRIICLSTDKAVFPVNAMGMTKALMEKLAQSVARTLGEGADTRIATVRYGNVLYSRGSVLPLFVRQIIEGKPITITEPDMTRFLMPLRDSVALVNYAIENARQGDLFVKKAPAATVATIVDAVKELFEVPNHPVQVIGWRHGEKLFETLISASEMARSHDLDDFIRVNPDVRTLNYSPFFSEGSKVATNFNDYHSHNTKRLNVAEVKELFLSLPEVSAILKTWRSSI